MPMRQEIACETMNLVTVALNAKGVTLNIPPTKTQHSIY